MPNIPLSSYIPVQYLPDFFKGLVNNISISREEFVTGEFGWSLNLVLAFENVTEGNKLIMPSADAPVAVSLDFGDLATMSIIRSGEDFALRLKPSNVKVLLPPILKNAIPTNGKWVAAESGRANVSMNFSGNYVEYNTVNGIEFLHDNLSSFIPTLSSAFLIGETGIAIIIQQLKFNVEDEVSMSIAQARFVFPESLGLIPDIEINKGLVNKEGISGEFKFEWDLVKDTTDVNRIVYKMNGQAVSLFGGFTGGLKSCVLVFKDSAIVSCDIAGELLLPYFDGNENAAISIGIKINDEGDITVLVKSAGGDNVILNKADLVRFQLASLEISRQAGATKLLLSGGLEPMLHASEGMKWPKMDVKELMLDSTGKFSVAEAWMDMKDLATLDLFGFNLELRKIGFGTTTDRLWIDLSGGLRLIDQIPVGLDVEGFKVSWPQDTSGISNLEQLSDAIDIEFKGIELSFAVPGAIQLDGNIRFFKEGTVSGFAGDMILVIPPAGITAEAGLMVGMNDEQPNPYKFFYVYFGLEAAAGIPLGQSGLALKGAMGIFGINVSPNKLPEENWYFDWYKKDPGTGAHQTTKWGNERDALAVGAGVTITTVDGVIKGTKGIIVLALPGPVLVINGRALILDALKPDANAEPPFSATAIFDGKEKIVQFNIEAQAEIVENLVDAYGSLEAFFDFKDVTNWHLYLGQDTPPDRRIRANILNVIEANAYLMLDMIGRNSPRARMGVDVSLNPKIDNICFDIPLVGEQCISFDAHANLSGSGEVSVQPEQFSGKAHLDAGIKVSALGLTVDIGASVDIDVEGPSPFSLQGDLDLYADLPSPLPDYEGTFHFELEIPKVSLVINDPLASVSLFSRFTSESKALVFGPGRKDTAETYLANSVIAACDINPILSFEHDMNQNRLPFIMHPGGIKSYSVGIINYTPALKQVIIRQRDKKGGSPWTIIYSTMPEHNKPILGAWTAESNPSAPANPSACRLQLMSNNPLMNTMFSVGTMGYLMMQNEAEETHLSEQVIENYPDLMRRRKNVNLGICVDFNYLGKAFSRTELHWAHLFFTSDAGMSIKDSCLSGSSAIKVTFPESVVKVEIEFCDKQTEGVFETFVLPGVKGQLFSAAVRTAAGYRIEVSTGFDAVLISSKQKDKAGIAIKSVCYYTVNSEKDQAANKIINDNNETSFRISNGLSGDVFIDNNLFKPGCYYEIEVLSALDAGLDQSKLRGYNAAVRGFVEHEFKKLIEPPPSIVSQYAYFQTDAPPQNLRPYMKLNPVAFNTEHVFIKDLLQFRFKRGYIKALYGDQASKDHQLSIYLKDAQNAYFPIKTFSWKTAGAATLFPDEEVWAKHLSSMDVQALFTKDDILEIDLRSVPEYQSGKKYEVVIAGKLRTDISGQADKNENVVFIAGKYYNQLFSKSLSTAVHPTFTDMLKGGKESGEGIVKHQCLHVEGNMVSVGNDFDKLLDALVKAEKVYYTCLVDYEYGIAKAKNGVALVSKEAVEHHKLKLREAREALDAEFRRIALQISSEVYLMAIANDLQIYALKTGSKVNAVWLKFPECCHLKASADSIGNLSIELKRKKAQAIFNSDTSQVIYVFDESVSASDLSAITLEFSKASDFKDDLRTSISSISNGHHRYDRPSLKGVEADQLTIMLT